MTLSANWKEKFKKSELLITLSIDLILDINSDRITDQAKLLLEIHISCQSILISKLASVRLKSVTFEWIYFK